MYTLLLVDDEEEVTRIIAKKVKWNDLGFSVTGHANNGLKALEMLEEMQPDVVMTDIRMRSLYILNRRRREGISGTGRLILHHAVRKSE